MMMTNFSFSGSEVLLIISSMVGSTFIFVAVARKFFHDLKSFNFNINFFITGIIMALIAVITCFSWESQIKDYSGYTPEVLDDQTIITPVTVWEKKKPPVLPPPPEKKLDIVLPNEEFKVKISSELLVQTEIKSTDVIEDSVIATDFDSMMVAAKAEPILAPPIEEEQPIVVIPERMPRFPGCEDLEISIEEKEACSKEKLLSYIYDKTKYPQLALEIGLEGQVVVQFVVEKNGEISDIKVVRELGGGCSEEAFSSVKSMNDLDEKWIPGRQRGKPVRVRYTLPIQFKLK